MNCRRWQGWLWVPVLLCAFVTAPIGEQARGAPREEWQKTLIIAVNGEPQTFDPAVNVASVSAFRFYPNVYESLVQWDPKGKLVPALAERWEVLDNGLRYRFHLVRNAKFSDGAPFDAEAAKAGFDRFLGIGKGLVTTFTAIKSIDVVDRFTVDFVLKERFAPFLAAMASWYGGQFVSPTAVRNNDSGGDKAQAWLHNHTVGTGPYTLESWVPENRVVLVRNPQYRHGWKAGQVERVVYILMREPSTARQALEGGSADMLEELVPSLIEPLKKARGVRVDINLNHGSFGQALYLNFNKAPFNNLNVRKAMAHAINYERLLAVWQGTATLAHGPFPPSFKPWFNERALVKYTYDPGKAREFLAKAGMSMPISPPLRFDFLWQSGFTVQRDTAQLLAEDWGKLGIQLNIIEAPLPVWRQAIWRNTMEIAWIQLALRYNDPDALASQFYPSWEFRNLGWNPGYKNARVDHLVELGRSTLGSPARGVYYAEFQNAVSDEVVLLHLVNKLHALGYRTGVEGIVWNPNYGAHFNVYAIRKNPGAR